ncbi:hypothetical protein GCM10008931_42540 [Oceanobacillus oncorhynchi subsp. oncorhynchi]|uniref:MvaI/BcnI family restriction endonuclease n=1 Tax=Oceanobacillus oncorhynchi TaxID=545501 RepID=UPI0031CDF81E
MGDYMIFKPYQDELEIINNVHKYNESEYAVIRLTATMIDKNNIDANALLRDLLKKKDIVDYALLKNGGNNGLKVDAKLLLNNSSEEIKMNLYKVNGKRSDPRFSISKIQQLLDKGKFNIGDLLYFSTRKLGNTNQIVILNTTNNIPSPAILLDTFGTGEITDSASRLIPMVKTIAQGGFHPNSKGSGNFNHKDAGDTLEYLLGIKTNNSQKADFEDKIEIKTKTGKSLNTLFTLRPQFNGTPVEKIEPNDRNRVSAFTRLYGYTSEKRKDHKSLYITIGTKEAPQNNVGFFLEVNEEERTVELRKYINNKKSEVVAFWTFSKLETELYSKHPATLWVKAERKVVEDTVQFKYFEAELSRTPQFTTFLSFIKSGSITYDWRGYTTPAGAYKGKNHGNAWRIKNKDRQSLFGNIEKIDLL